MMSYILWIGVFLMGGVLWPFVENSLLSPGLYVPLLLLTILIYWQGFADKRNLSNSSFDKIEITDLDHLTGLEFEDFLASFFEQRGYQVELTQATQDQGADLILVKSHRKFVFKKSLTKTVVQAKRYKNNVGNSSVQQVVAAKGHYDCDQAMVITNSCFTASAQELASSNQVELWDRSRLQQELKETPIFFENLNLSNNLT